jgi:hypothetical protein
MKIFAVVLDGMVLVPVCKLGFEPDAVAVPRSITSWLHTTIVGGVEGCDRMHE